MSRLLLATSFADGRKREKGQDAKQREHALDDPSPRVRMRTRDEQCGRQRTYTLVLLGRGERKKTLTLKGSPAVRRLLLGRLPLHLYQ